MLEIENAREFGEISRQTWGRMLALARAEHIEKGHLFDPRLSAINIWYSPEDRPDGQHWPVTCGALPVPRDYHSGLFAEDLGERVLLYLSVSNYGAEEAKKRETKGAPLPGMVKLRMVDSARRGGDADWKWAEEKFRDLVRRAEAGEADGLPGIERHIVRNKDTGEEVEWMGI